MRNFALVLAMSLVVQGSALAVNPSFVAGGGGMHVFEGGMNVLANDRTVILINSPDLDGVLVSSETYDGWFDSEVADDVMFQTDATVGAIGWWGGYWDVPNCNQSGAATHWIIRIFEDGPPGACIPAGVVMEFDVSATETYVTCQSTSYPIFYYEAPVSFSLTAFNRFWVSMQCVDHVYPPHVGRLTALQSVDCDCAFRSLCGGFPEWVPISEALDIKVNGSLVFYDEVPSPVERTTWGAVKQLYR
jgi:hypothetical protein